MPESEPGTFEILPIRLFERDGVLYSLDNRRLEVFKRAGFEVPYRMATNEEIAKKLEGSFVLIMRGLLFEKKEKRNGRKKR